MEMVKDWDFEGLHVLELIGETGVVFEFLCVIGIRWRRGGALGIDDVGGCCSSSLS